MNVKTEGQHAGEFIVGEFLTGGDPSREEGTLASGQDLQDGTILALSGGKLIAHTGALNTEGAVASDVVGILIGNWDASGGDVDQVPYFARLGVVKEALLTYPTESTEGGEKAAVDAALLANFIILR